ncbi:hypothetical protein MS2017_1362 [Bathymodiolus thermophilus thioautotrophic gill symbiont]|uniref:Fibronectin type-III domain-containing protein n=1 Tax=Bathymodiolus thermophilus thioautotrophic gill symbiont TaxID=2360 RepID=A0A3G3IMG8_9GAMM|nr:hypothetical protein [Bathymodiolus thermophilus thioautotrophic gill symbiont]AYQ57050.1 hypothetical protein MS2017_1362 [Bathymodiolus thermophilus thioautotrophic gill symbiont]
MTLKILVTIFALALTACGGGGGGGSSSGDNPTKSSLSIGVSGVDENNKFYFFKGQSDEIYLSNNSAKETTYKIIDAPFGVEMGSDKINIASNANVDNTQLKVQASNDTEFGETTINLRGLEPIVLIDEVTTGDAELFTDKYNLVQINIPEINNVPAGTRIKYIGAKKDDDLWIFQALIDENVDVDSIEINLLADSEKFNTIYGQQSGASQNSIRSLNATSDQLKATAYYSSPDDSLCEKKSNIAKYNWGSTKGRFIRNHYRVDDLSGFNMVASKRISSLICANKPEPISAKLENRIPIVFIHGYAVLAQLGGGYGTWGEFIKYASNWKFNNKSSIVFDFHWKTNAKFQTVSNELSKYINKIKNITGERVHIIAHSFGGVLARTYLQNLSGNNVSVPVASLTTIGTPHSGIGKSGGYDSAFDPIIPTNAENGLFQCKQISCYQMGDDFDDSDDFNLFYKFKEKIGLNEVVLEMDKKEFLPISGLIKSTPVQVLIGIRKRLGGLLWGSGDALISYDGQRFKPNDVTGLWDKYGTTFRNSIKVVNNTLVKEDFIDTENGYIHVGGLQYILSLASSISEVKIENELHPSVVKSKQWIENNLLDPIETHNIAYKINVIDPYGNPYSGKFKVTSKDENILTMESNAINGVATIHVSYTGKALRRTEFNIEPTNSLLYSNNPRIVVFEPESYMDVVNTGKTIDLRNDFYDESNDTKTGKIKLNSATQIDSSNFTINGENLSGDISVCVVKYNGYCQDVEILSKNDTSMRARFDSLGGVRKVFIEKKNSLGVNIDKDNLGVNFVKTQDSSLSISALTPDKINASSYSQKITISGAGFSRDTVVYAQEGNNSYKLRSSHFIDENTIDFRLRTGLNTQSPWNIWVETPTKSTYQNNKLALIVNTNVNNICTANESDYQSCPISHGIGTKHRVCADNGNSWGSYSSCSVSSCNSEYHVSDNSCVADVIIPVLNRPSGLTPGTDNNNPDELDTTNITLRWSAVNNASKYKLSVFDLNTRRYILEDEYVVGISYNASSFLDFGHQYFWSLHACKSNNECSSRTRVYFNIAGEVITPDVPTGLTPGSISNSNPEEVSGTTQVMRWNVANNASWYKIQIAKEGHIIADETINTNSYTVNNLEPGRKYWWHVEACNNDACADSTGKNFIIEGSAQICTPNSKENRSCGISHGQGSKYKTCSLNGQSWSGYSNCAVTSCNNGYYLLNNNCVTDVIPVPDRPSGLTPGADYNNPDELDTTNIILHWSTTNNASKYKLSIFDLNTRRYMLENKYITSTSYNASNLMTYGHKYFWSLHACKSNNECSSRRRVYFNVTGEIIVPDKPTGLTPGSTSSSNPEEVSGTTQVMRWNVANNASWYKIQIAKEGHIIADETINTNSYTVNNLEPGRKYWWYVEACNNDACADSTGKNFMIEGSAQICTPNSKENRSCSISHGQGSKYKTCSLNGQSWSGYSNCAVTSCDNGYQESNNRCVGAISITPSNTCSSAPTMKVDTNYQININTSDYTFGSPIEQHSYLSGDVRGFWLKVEIPIGYDARNVNISNVNDDFDPVIGLRSNCNYEYYGYADDNAGGGDETFNTRLTGAEEGNNGIYHIRIYHYNGNESPQAIFNIDVTQ